MVKIYVSNISQHVPFSDVEKLFSQYGTVLSFNLVKDRNTGESKGYGFVEMEEEDAKEAIIRLDGIEYEGRSLQVMSLSGC